MSGTASERWTERWAMRWAARVNGRSNARSNARATMRATMRTTMRPNRWLLATLMLATVGGWLYGTAPSHAEDTDQARQLAELMDTERTPRRVRLALFKAQTYRERGQADAAIAVLEDHLARHPDQDHYLVRYQLGNLLAMSGNMQEALPHLQKAVQLEPQLYPAWRNLGEVAYELGQNELAAEAFETAFAQDPDSTPEILYYAAANWLFADRADRAVPLCETLVSGRYAAPHLEWYRGLATACVEAGTPGRAAPAMAELVRRFPDDPNAWLLAYNQAAAAGDYRRAALAMTVVGLLRPLTGTEQLQLGDLYGAIDVPATAVRHYAAALADSATADRYERLVSSYLASYQLDRALTTLERALADTPTARLWSLAGDVRYRQENYAAALAAYNETARLDPEAGRPHLMMGYCALELGEIDAAAAHLRRAVEFPSQAESARRLLTSLVTDIPE